MNERKVEIYPVAIPTQTVQAAADHVWGDMIPVLFREMETLDTIAIFIKEGHPIAMLVPCGELQKHEFAVLIKQMVLLTTVDGVVMCGEAWAADFNTDDHPGLAEEIERVGIGIVPKHLVEEVIWMTWKTKDGVEGSRKCNILRDDGGHPSMGPPSDMFPKGHEVDNGVALHSNRFLDGIWPSEVH